MNRGWNGESSEIIYYLKSEKYASILAKQGILDAPSALQALSEGKLVEDETGDLVDYISPNKQYKIRKTYDFEVGDRVKVRGENEELLIVKILISLYLVYTKGHAAGLPRLLEEWTMEEIQKECIPATLIE